MGFVGGVVGYRMLKMINPGVQTASNVTHYEDDGEKLVTHFGPEIWSAIAGKTVIDFGCGTGREAVTFAQRGAKKVIGVDIQDRLLNQAIQWAQDSGVAERCAFVKATDEKADFVLSLDSFEHFDDPLAILCQMSEMLNENGQVWISFGWPWYHPFGGHLFSVFPWAHLIFTEKALIRWRSDFKTDGATRFHEVEGGLNQMSIARLERTVAASPLEIIELRLTPIRVFRPIHNRLTREFTSALVQARLQAKK